MTMTQPQRVILYRLLTELRADWHSAGVNDACVELATRDGSPFELIAQAVRQAGIAANRTPACIVWPVTDTTPQPTIGTPTPASLTVWCEPCGANTQLRPDGQKACCWSAGFSDNRDYKRAGTSTPPAGLRSQVAAALHREDAR